MAYDYNTQPTRDGYRVVTLTTEHGDVACNYYPVRDTKHAAIFVGGAGGGWDSPAHGLYPQLCRDLVPDDIASLRICYRHPNVLNECVLDVLSGVVFLEHEGIEAVALIGHSFGGAVVVGAAVASRLVRTVVTLSTQTYGLDPIGHLYHCSTLLIHGRADRVLSAHCSEYGYARAQEPKKLILYDNAGHGLDEVRADVLQNVHDWIANSFGEILLDTAN